RPGRALVVGPAAGTSDAGQSEESRDRVLLFAGPTPQALLRQLAVPDDELIGRDDTRAVPTGGACRLAVVAADARRLATARRVVAAGTAWRGVDDVWFSPRPLLGGDPPADGEAGRTAFLFCGLEHAFAPRIDDVAEHLGLGKLDLGGTEALGSHGMAGLTV
nr:hypothetical protein [Micromonospora sp. DSM 115978]